jgi:hypothetical protein
MPSSSTNYSYDIPTVGSDSTTYGTIINEFVNSLATKLKAVSDAINTAGVGASSTLAQVNRNIAQVDAINSRIPVGVADLLPDPYSGATTPVSTWPYLNTELQAEGYSPPTTAQEVLDFDYEGFATYLNTRFDSLSARIVGLDAPITIADSSRLIYETNKILDALGTTKTVTTTTTTSSSQSVTFFDITITGSQVFPPSYEPFGGSTMVIQDLNFGSFITALAGEGISGVTPSRSVGSNVHSRFNVYIRALDVTGTLSAGGRLNPGIYLDLNYTINGGPFYRRELNKDLLIDAAIPAGRFVNGVRPWWIDLGVNTFDKYGVPNLDSLSNYGSKLKFVKVTETNTTTETSTQVPVTLADIDFSECG